MTASLTSLKIEQVYKSCSLNSFDFEDTSSVSVSNSIIGQERAIKAIKLGLEIERPGYHIYVAGPEGAGRKSTIKDFLRKSSKNKTSPKDIIIVYNFEDPNLVQTIHLKAGEASKFSKKFARAIKNLLKQIPLCLQKETFEFSCHSHLSEENYLRTKKFSKLQKKAQEHGFEIRAGELGFDTLAIIDGNILSEEEYLKLPDNIIEQTEKKRTLFEPEILKYAREIREAEQKSQKYLEKNKVKAVSELVTDILSPFYKSYRSSPELCSYFEQIKDYIAENIDLLAPDHERADEYEEVLTEQKKFAINVFVDNSNKSSPPIIFESNPNYYNIFGKIEKNIDKGIYTTDFTLIRAGALQRANGGYLILDAHNLLKEPYVWEALKRSLKNQNVTIEDMGEKLSWVPTTHLRPAPTEINVKVILIGSDEIYRLLYEEDLEFSRLFKVKADFDNQILRNNTNIKSYISFIATRAAKENLLPFHKTAVEAIIEYGSTATEQQKYLTTCFSKIKDLCIEAHYISKANKKKVVRRKDIEEAILTSKKRVDLIEQKYLSSVRENSSLLHFKGTKIGQINGVSVYDLEDLVFGVVNKITCVCSKGEDGIIHIEREVRLSGKIHSKAEIILTRYLDSLISNQKQLSFSASVCFEQSYGQIDGDSASVAELAVVVSALAKIPCKQNFAVTGSLNQIGEVQPVGGINQKIEGYYRTCKEKNSAKDINMIIPKQNISNLMLAQEVRDAIKSKQLKIWAVTTFSQAFNLLTGHVFDKGKNSAISMIKKNYSTPNAAPKNK
jgi:lon-related putative ATP-dependent protease